MKRFTKISLIIAGVLACVGVFTLAVATAGGFTLDVFEKMVEDGKFSFGSEDIHQYSAKENKSQTEIDEVYTSLDIEYGAGELKIYYDDVEKVQIEQENVTKFDSYVDEGVLHIKGENGSVSSSDAVLVVVIPKGMKFDEVDLELGASKAEIDGLVANSIDIEVGAGKADVLNLDATNLSADVGVGQLVITAVGKETDYNYKVECGIGSVKIGGQFYQGIGTEKNITYQGASRFMDVECGIGEIQIQFNEEIESDEIQIQIVE